MLSDKFDKKIKEAADQYHPAYNEQAWTKMEKLLDKHLPAKDNRKRRIIFFLLFFMLLAGAGLFLSGAFNQKKKINGSALVEAQEPNNDRDKINGIQKEQPGKNNITVPVEQKEIDPDTSAVDSKEKKNKTIISRLSKGGEKKFYKEPAETREKNRKSTRTNNMNGPELKNKIADKYNMKKNVLEKNKEINEDPAEITAGTPRSTGHTIGGNAEKNDNNTPDSNITTNTSAQKPQIQESENEDMQEPGSSSAKKKNKKRNSLFFTLSAGPDISFAGTEKAGELKPVFGIGAGLHLGDNFTLRTGFYTGRKVYSSSPGSYNPPPSFYTYYPYLEKVDADCKVYEIPLLLSYHFKKSAKGNWFASAGLSSYLMKKEIYNYTYKYTPAGQSFNKEFTIKNKNNHFFSVLTLSGGYRRQLSKSAFIMVEPNLKLPLSGVGYGKVKLNSAGILFSFGVTPFHGAKK